MPPIGLSSSEIRQRVAAQKSIRFRTPRAVEKYIQNAGLYRNAT
jgi:nicotinate-nucleotide adenylyltransferase